MKAIKDIDDARREGFDIRKILEAAEPFSPPASSSPGDGQDNAPGHWRANVVTAHALRTKNFPPISYIVPDLIPEGLTILAGRPKVGKSWAALDLAIAASADRFCFGDWKPLYGDVLYCALEDNHRRLQSRIRKVLNNYETPWPERLTLATRWRPLDGGGVADIQDWADSVIKPVLIILDTLAGVKPSAKFNESLYQGDYKSLEELQKWAGTRGIAVIVLHHTRKMESDDPVDSISGSLGLTGCADTFMVLAKTGQGPTLYVRGRDVEEADHAIQFNKETCRWTILGDAAEIHRSETRQKILGALLDAKESMTPPEIASVADIIRNNVDQRLGGMVKDGEVIKISRGKYVHPQRQDLIELAEPNPHKNHKNKKGDAT